MQENAIVISILHLIQLSSIGGNNMWIKYSYVCNDCDALTEITTIQKLYDYRGWCACGSANLVRVAIEDSTVKDKYETKITLP